MSTISVRRKQIAESLRDKSARDQFIESEIDVGIPTQVFTMRKARKLTQKQLGDLASMAQARISLIETPGSADLNLATLKALASAFDVGLMVRFVPLSAQVDLAARLSLVDINPPSYADDSDLKTYEIESSSYNTSLPRAFYVVKHQTDAPEVLASDQVA